MGRQAAWRRPVTATAVLVAALIAWVVATGLNEAAKLSPELRAAFVERAGVNIVVELPFAPERFHMVYFQARGRVVRAEDRRLYLRDVSPEDVRRIAGEYWVAQVRLWDDG